MKNFQKNPFHEKHLCPLCATNMQCAQRRESDLNQMEASLRWHDEHFRGNSKWQKCQHIERK